MSPQLYLTVYEEQFASPGRVKREQLRPTSAHRRNNPQPRPDFLFPRSLWSKYTPHRAFSHLLPPVDSGRPLFPPVRHLSFHSPVVTCPDNHLKAWATGEANLMPPVCTAVRQALPPADELQKLQPIQLPVSSGFKLQPGLKSPTREDYHPVSAQLLRQRASARLPPRPRTSNPVAALHVPPLAQCRRSAAKISLDYSGCHSCFHVVKPYHAAHYTIHPEFVSECLR
ncbi:uncharacterized protein LOC142880416 [Nelusetta ayraudi]|uniref:uncharacterized protein LOC142880416 n=1 Tax=Nelusetta ayraudi TaxID=303726 RepID=UPI003F6FA672